MADEKKPRVDVVTGTYYRKGKCVCGRQAERERTFVGPSLEDISRQADEWTSRPIRHKKCEWLYTNIF